YKVTGVQTCALPISGLVICIRNGPTIYHTGDTGFFSDIARVSDYNKIDIMLVCIGDHFTMGPIRAADAVKLVGPGMVIPMHYGRSEERRVGKEVRDE